MRLRLLRPDDMPGIMRLVAAAGWNQLPDDWLRVLQLAPESCFAVEMDGQVVTTTTVIRYGTDLAWVGMVLTAPEYRGQGYARAALEHALRWVDGQQVAWTGLDATDMGAPLYEQLGFQTVGIVERWFRTPAPFTGGTTAGPYQPQPLLDTAAFGADRSELLALLASYGGWSIDGGYALSRTGRMGRYFGPCVANRAATAAALAAACLAQHANQPLYWDIWRANASAAAVAQELGFAPARHLRRMVRRGAGPEPLRWQAGLTWALAGFELG